MWVLYYTDHAGSLIPAQPLSLLTSTKACLFHYWSQYPKVNFVAIKFGQTHSKKLWDFLLFKIMYISDPLY